MIALMFIAAAASAPTVASLQVRVIQAGTKTATLDPRLKDIQNLFKSLAFSSYELKDQSTLKLDIDGDPATQKLPAKRTLKIAAKGNKKKLQLEMEIPELKFKTKAQVAPGASLVVGGPKFEDGVLLFALTLIP